MTTRLVPVTVPTPGSMLRLVALLTFQLRVEPEPGLTPKGDAEKEEIQGVPTTVRVRELVILVPATLVTVRI